MPKSPEAPAPPRWSRPWAVAVGVAGAEMLLLAWVAAHRAVNADEGFYALAGWRVLGGAWPYADFFFPQMPYMPYLQAAAFAVAGPSLVVGRAVSVVAGGLLAGVLVGAATRWSGRASVGVVVGVAFAAHALTLSYLPIVKPYAVASLGAVIALVLLTASAPGAVSGFAAGVSLGVAVGARLPTVAIGPVLLVVVAVRGGWRPAAAFGAGAAVASLPWLVVAAVDPGAFWFNNLGFHSLRREISGTVAILGQKLIVLGKWVLLPQNALLWAAAACGVWRRPRETWPAAACAATIGAAYLAATPTYVDYFVQVAPFLLLAAVPTVGLLLERRGLALAVAAVYVVGLVVARRAAPEDSERGEKARLWRLDTVARVAAYLEANSAPGDRILSWWEGYPFLAHREGFAGLGFWESNASRKVSAAQRAHFHLMHPDDVRNVVIAREARLVVYPDGTWESLADELRDHYQPAARFGSLQVLAARPLPGDAPRAGRAPSAGGTAVR